VLTSNENYYILRDKPDAYEKDTRELSKSCGRKIPRDFT
jgi:hypothetical protein